MSELRRLLEGSGPDRHAAIIADHVSSATTAELVAVLSRPAPHLSAFVRGELTDELVDRGTEAVPELGRALVADPLGTGGLRLAEILADIHHIQPTAREAVTAVLTEAIEAALDGGAGTWGVGELVGRLAGCVAEAGAPARTQALGHRLLTLAATEAEPYPPLLVTAQWVAHGHGPATECSDH